jgi:hypothetical protein
VPDGAVMTPPATVQDALQVLFVMTTLAGAVGRAGQVAHVTGAVVALAEVLTQPVVVLLQRANTVIALVV